MGHSNIIRHCIVLQVLHFVLNGVAIIVLQVLQFVLNEVAQTL